MSAKFVMKATQADPEGYYYTNWDCAIPITVTADTKQAAVDEAHHILGPTPSRGRYWVFRVESVEATP